MGKLITFQIFMFSLLFSIIFAAGYSYQKMTVETVHLKVIDKQRVSYGSGSKYIIFSENESFENTDSLYHRKHDSSDIYAHFHIGCSYEVSVYGKRMPFFSTYRNIIEILKKEPCSSN
jgi:hypothetical protein